MKIKFYAFFCLLFLSALAHGQNIGISISPQGAALCSGAEVTLTATPSGGTAPYNFVWSTGATTASINVNKPITYTVTVTDQNGTSGTQSVTVTSVATPVAPKAVNQSGAVCLGSPAKLVASGSGGTYNWYDAAGNHKFTGDVYNTEAITQNTTYYVDATLGICTGPRTPVNVTLIGSPYVPEVFVCAGSPATFTAQGAVTYQWYDAAGNKLSTGPTFTTGALNVSTSFFVTGTVNGCTSAKIEAKATVKPLTPAPKAGGPYVICTSSRTTLSASGVNGAIYDWFDTPTGGTSLISSPDFTTPVLTQNTTYWVQATVDDCVGPRTAVTVQVNQPPATPTATVSGSICYNSPAQLSVTNPVAGQTYVWYSSLTATIPFATGAVITTAALMADNTFYVMAVNGPCVSERSPVAVDVADAVDAPVVTGATLVCPGTPTTLTATGGTGTYQWFTNASGGAAIFTGAAFTTPNITANTTYYVQLTIASGCVGSRTAVTVSVIAPPPAPTATPATTCAGGSATLIADNGTNFQWYATSTGGTPIASGKVFNTPALTATTTYYVESVTANGCAGLRTAVVATVVPAPASPAAAGPGNLCPNTSAQLTASGSTGSYEWYNTLTGGVRLATTAVFNTPALGATSTFYVQAVTPEGCASPRTAVTVNVTPVANPQFQYSSGTYIVTDPVTSPVINNPGGTFQASPAGLTINPATGAITPSGSIPNTYQVTYTPPSGFCAVPASVNIKITPLPVANFAYSNSQYCQDGVNPSPIFPPNGSAGRFTSTTGLVFVNPTTGQIDLKNSVPGPYTVTNTINSGGSPVSETFAVEIFQRVVVNAGQDQIIPTGGTAQLAASVSSGISVTWTAPAGSGSFSDIHDINAAFKPTTGNGTVLLTLTTSDPVGPCDFKTSQVRITVAGKPAAPTAAAASVCIGNPAALSATAPGGNYEWFNAATGGTLLKSGPNFTTDPLTTSTTFYVQTTINGATSDRTTVIVTVNPVPLQPTVTGSLTICKGTNASLTVNETAEAYRWYDLGGNLKGNTQTFTPVVNQSTTYFVETITGTCVSPRTRVDLIVNPTAVVTSASSGEICSGQPQNYQLAANIATATFIYSRAAVTGISNADVNNQPVTTLNETLINTTNTVKTVVYVITPFVNGCAGTPFTYTVTVYPTPKLVSAPSKNICNETSVDYLVQIDPAAASFTWSRAQVAGISNASIAGQESLGIREVLHNTTNAPVTVQYVLNFSTLTCVGEPYTFPVTVAPTITINSGDFTLACPEQPLGYEIVSNADAAGVTFTWFHPQVAGNPATTGTSKTINEVLRNTTGQEVDIYYYIVPALNGCPGKPFNLHVVVKPQLQKPHINTNTPVCSGKSIVLQTAEIPGATYLWSRSDGFKATTQVPLLSITADVSGTLTYNLRVIANDCALDADPKSVTVNYKPVAKAPADQAVCPVDLQIPIHGEVTGGATGGAITGQWSVVTGSGKFLQLTNSLDNVYEPSAEDKERGFVVLSLKSTNTDDCEPAVDEVKYTFERKPAANAGEDQIVCNQSPVLLNGKILISSGTGRWTTTDGDGSFNGTETKMNAVYTPGLNDISNGSVKITLRADNPTLCDLDSDEIVITLQLPPNVNAGPTRYVLTGKQVTLLPVVSDDDVTYFWSPSTGLSDPTIKNPVVTGGLKDIVYTLIITNKLGCVSDSSTVTVKVSPPVIIPNTFTPNGDGTNDNWKISGIEAYPKAVVDIFDRSGQAVFHSAGYGNPWDGTTNGKALPFGVYYFIIDTKEFNQKFSGYVTVVR